MRSDFIALLLLSAAALGGCSSITDKVYYSAWEKFGYEKRDLLVSQVQDTRQQQEQTKQQFASALDRFREVYHFDGGDVEDAYDKLNQGYEDSAAEADRLRNEIADVKSIGEALFDEWDDEIDQQTVADFKKRMKELRKATRRSYDQMVSKMDEAAAKMNPVLEAFKGQVLMLKSSLNARAIASLQTEAQGLVDEVEELIEEMNESIQEADEFIEAMGAG
jgi:ElaB/YqjD/DUF883 family membrane-anchored ribosome-binding protein